MGSEPLLLMVGDWTLEIKINDFGAEIMMHTGRIPRTTHFMRLDPKQAGLLADYLDQNVSSTYRRT